MSNGITASSALLESYRDTDGFSALARVQDAEGMSGCAIQIRLVNCGKTSGSFWLANRDGDNCDYVLLLPSPRWEQDARDAGWILKQKLSTQGHTP